MSSPAKARGRAKVAAPDSLLMPFQKRWVKDRARIKLMEKSRQIGMSWGAAYDAVCQASASDAPYDVWVSSRDEIQANLFLNDAASFAGLLSLGAQDLGERVVDELKHTAHILRFSNGRAVNSMSSNPDAQAGKRGSRILDEFALHADPRKLYSIAYPGITWGGQLAILSTHRGSGNFFNQLVEESRHKGNPKKISLHRVTLEDALNEGLLAKLQMKLPAGDPRQDMDEAQYLEYIHSGCPDEETFLQEYMCVPADDAAAFIDYSMIDGCAYRPDEPWEQTLGELAKCTNPLYLGVDVGREHDLTVMWLVEMVGGTAFTRRIEAIQGMPFSGQEEILYSILDLPMLRRCCIDQTGIGRQFAERAQERFGKYRVEGVTFTAPVKEELAFPVRGAFEDRRIRIPNKHEIRTDLRGIRKETTAAGNIRFTGERSDRGHCDRFWALALSLHAAATTTSNPRAILID